MNFRIGREYTRAVGSKLCDVMTCCECGKKIVKQIHGMFPLFLEELAKNADRKTD